jgi:WD repeat-containing protein 23
MSDNEEEDNVIDITSLLSHYLRVLTTGRGEANNPNHQTVTQQRRRSSTEHKEYKADTSRIQDNDITTQIKCHNHLAAGLAQQNLFNYLQLRSIRYNLSLSTRTHQSQRYIPDWLCSVNHYDSRAFVSKYSCDGESYTVATQDNYVRVYHNNTTNKTQFKSIKDIHARSVGWAILDADYSPDSKFIIYSTWSPFIQLANISGDYELHEALQVTDTNRRFSLFSIKFSHDNREILGGSCDRSFYLYDIERKQCLLALPAHEDDINSVCWADEKSQIFATASDDTQIKIWDRRILSDSNNAENGEGSAHSSSSHRRCVGKFLGNCEGVCHISSKGDTRYFLSQGKDQAIRLWDMRRADAATAQPNVVRNPHWDYRWEHYPGLPNSNSENDSSIMKYMGHQVFETLIRCYFSPLHSTGQRYIYTGSRDGIIYIYDALTGEIVNKLIGHHATVRDVSWHPYEPTMISSSFDHSIGRWELYNNNSDEEESKQRPEPVAQQDQILNNYTEHENYEDDTEGTD